MSKFDFGELVTKVQNSLKDESKKKSVRLGSELASVSQDPKDYVILPEELEWKESTGLLGLPFGKLVQIAGKSDVGKTSFAVEAMKAAQDQEYGVIYVETEGKTSPEDLKTWGVDPEGILLIQSGIAENAYASLFELWDAFFEKYPEEKLLVVIDSWGNTLSQKDSELDFSKDSQQPGYKAKVNRLVINKMITKMQEDNVALLVLNYTYDNIASPGKTNAGGEAIHFFTYVGFQASRTAWVTRQKNGKKVRSGVKVKWKNYKNHAAKSLEEELPEEIEYKITKDGFKRIDNK